MVNKLPLSVALAPGGYGTIRLGDHDISLAVRGVHIDAAVGEITQVTLDLTVVEVTEFGDSQPRYLLTPGVHDALITLGWTPPADEA